MNKGYLEKPEELDFYIQILTRVIRDSADLCNLRPSSIERDIVTVRQRTMAEGLTFLTKVLPSLGKSLDKALSNDSQFTPPSSFEKSKKMQNLPLFLKGFWQLIFNQNGMIADSPERCADLSTAHAMRVTAVRAVRQICYLFYKLEGCHSKVSETEVINNFIVNDQSLPEETEEVPLSPKAERALERARLLIWEVLKDFDPLDIVPGHGPGSVATGEKLSEKMNFRRFYERLDKVYSYPEYFFFNYSHLCDELEALDNMETCSTSTAKVVLVPKDSRGPRLISMEPLELQWIQQGLLRSLVRTIEQSRSITSGYVNFTSQQINRDLARLATTLPKEDNRYNLVTLDMKDASDRVSLWLVRKLFPSNIYDAFVACRSESTKLPDGRVLRLKKFAPMGSAVCFPVEALVFWALAVGSVLEPCLWRWFSSSFKKGTLPEVWVYGDDIICCKAYYDQFSPIFKECFLTFNEDKCCTGSHFRESCGADVFMFEDVAPIRLKARWRDLSPPARLSYISYINNLQERGLTQTSEFLEAYVRSTFGAVPVTNLKHTYSYAITKSYWTKEEVEEYNLRNFKERWNTSLQRIEIKVPLPTPHQILMGAPGWTEVLRLHRFWGYQTPDGGCLSLGPCRYAVPRQLKTRWRWIGLYTLSN